MHFWCENTPLRKQIFLLLMHTRKHARTHALTHSQACIHRRTLTHTYAQLTCTRTRLYACTRTRLYACAHASRTRTSTHRFYSPPDGDPVLPPPPPPPLAIDLTDAELDNEPHLMPPCGRYTHLINTYVLRVFFKCMRACVLCARSCVRAGCVRACVCMY